MGKHKMNNFIIKIFFLFITSLLTGCYHNYKIDNTSQKESYKTLNELSVVIEQTDTKIINAQRTNVHYVNWGNGTGMSPVFTFSEPLISNESCKSLNKIYFNKITNKLPNLIQLFEDKNIIVNNNQATKKLTITIKEYNCTNNIIYLQASLFEDRNLIYQNLFVLDSYSNSNSFKTFYKDEKMDINKFFKVLIEDLENSMKFPLKK